MRRFVVTGFVLAMIFASVHADAATKAGKVFGAGSDVTYKLQVALDTLYNNSAGCTTVAATGQQQPLDFSCLPDDPSTITTENYAHDVVSEAYPSGASVGISQLCANLGGVDFVRNTRTTKSGDCTGMHFVPFARDGIAWECFGTCHNVTNLSTAQLQGIYGNCSITDWSQVGGTAGPIKVYSVKPGSGIRTQWTGFLGISSDNACSPDSAHIIRQNQNAPILANGDQNDAIFYFSVGNHRTNVKFDDGSKLGNLNGVTPSVVNVGAGTYPFTYYLSEVYCAASSGSSPCPAPASQQTLNYVQESTGWLCKGDATSPHTGPHATDPETGVNYRIEIQRTISAFGFAPLPYGVTGGSASGSSFCREFET
jgi:ABC-type phosphate transport system substrate-binding protein